jgi:ssRNA-specific RNase YbeY (16S rRNA maturation enzyme)
MRISIFNLTRKPRLPCAAIRGTIFAAARKERARFLETNVVIAGLDRLRTLNRTYFHKDRPTNVISFQLGTVCEIYVARPLARSDYELCYFIMHGFLHALGYDHRRTADRSRMDEKCRSYLKHV